MVSPPTTITAFIVCEGRSNAGMIGPCFAAEPLRVLLIGASAVAIADIGSYIAPLATIVVAAQLAKIVLLK